jgi:putative phosphoribosyl transferase
MSPWPRPDEPARLTEVHLEVADGTITGDLGVPDRPVGVVAFAHGSGSSRHSRRNQQVASTLREAGFVTFLMDLLTPEEAAVDERTREHRFDIGLLAGRVAASVDWLQHDGRTRGLPVGLFGASTGAAAALVAAAERPDTVAAVVSRGGRPDLAGEALPRVAAPTLLLVGGRDEMVIRLNEEALARLRIPAELVIVSGATHLFEEPGALEEVASLARGHFAAHLR